MPILPFLLVCTGSVMVSIMSILRKEYQIQNGKGLTTTIFFSLFISIIGFLFALLVNKGFEFDLPSLFFAGIYALISTVTASICICATAYGSVSTLLLWAMLGNLVLPSLFGIITQPAENSLSPSKILGFLMALVCVVINFVVDKNKKRSDFRFKLLCALVFFTNGSALIIFNLKNRLCDNISNIGFISEYLLLTVAITSIWLICINIKNKAVFQNIKSTITRKSFTIMICYAGLFLASELLALLCSGILPLVIQAPISFCVPIITTAIIDYLVYKVKLTKLNFIQIIFALLCCFCFN